MEICLAKKWQAACTLNSPRNKTAESGSNVMTFISTSELAEAQLKSRVKVSNLLINKTVDYPDFKCDCSIQERNDRKFGHEPQHVYQISSG